MSLRGLGILNFKNDKVSGEQCFLREYLSPISSPVVVDVGANEGTYSLAVLDVNRNARVFSFEPHPKTFGRLTQAAAATRAITAINAACGNARGKMILYDYAGREGTAHASLQKGVIEEIHKGKPEQHLVDVLDLDTFAKEHGIGFVHLLKIDTEGHELEVLKGAASLLQQDKIGAIQFEFTQINVISRTFLKDFYDFLPSYRFYRTVRDGLLPLGDYAPLLCELFAFQNIVALPNNAPRKTR